MIKLEVDHNKHPNNSGAKLEIKKNTKEDKGKSVEKDLKIIAEDKDKEKKEKDDKKDKKDKKGKKDEKKPGKQEAEPDAKGKKGKDDKKDAKDKKDKKDKGKGKPSPDKQQKRSPKKRNDVELDTIKSIHKSENKAKLTIEQLIAQYKDAANQILFNNHNGHDPTKEKQIEQQLQSLHKQKEKRHKKLEELGKHKEELYNSREKQKELKRQLREEKMRENKIKRIEEKLGNLQISAEERKAEYAKFLEYVKERQQFKPRFKRYEEQFKESLEEAEEDYKEKLDEIIKKYEPMNKHELDHFQENYMLQKEETENYRENKIKLEQDIIEQENEKIRKKLWRGQCHRNVRDEMDHQLDKKKEPKDKLQSMREYGKYIAQQHVKDRERKAAEKEETEKSEEQEIDKEKLHVHEKYFKGVNYGLVTDEKTLPLTIEEKLKLGNVYLEHAREMAKQKKNKTVDVTNSKQLNNSQQLKNRSQTFKVKRVVNPYYPSSGNRKSLDFSNYETIEYSLQKIESLAKDRKLQDQIIQHGEYSGILQIQQRKRKVGSLIVKQINEKLDLLKKL